MSWLNDLASGLGIPGGAAVLAGAMYAACAAAEKAARPEALKDIGRILKNTSWERSVRPSAIIERLFKLTFGERHLSWKCIGRSCLATLSIFFAAWVTLILVAHPSALHWPSDGGTAFAIGLTVLTLGALPDYISLWMTRGLLNVLGRHDRLVATLVVVSLDACLSLLASVLIVSFVSSKGAEDTVGEEAIRLLHALIHPGDRDALSAFPLSTLFTSIWTILILLSTTALKFLAPVHRFTSWFFDVDKHPVQAIGIVSGGLVIIGSMIWTVLRAIP